MLAECLWSTEDCATESLLYDNLSRNRVDNYKPLSTLKKLEEQSQHQPEIYMQQLVSGNGRSPSAGQLLKILDIMEAYIAGSRTRDTAGMSGVIDDVAANKIDKWAKRKKSIPSARTEQGYRRYMKRRPRKTTDDALLSQSSITPPKTTNDALLSRDTSNVSNV